MKDDEGFQQKVSTMADEFDQWLPTKDFDKMTQEKPDFSDFFNNLKLVSGEDFIRGNHFGFFSALFQLFLRDKEDIENNDNIIKNGVIPVKCYNCNDNYSYLIACGQCYLKSGLLYICEECE
jgi:hypothetical protein